MARVAREKSMLGIYHVILRGNNKQNIFYDKEDHVVFLNRIKLAKEKHNFDLLAFCLMSNHVHLLIKEIDTPIGTIFQSLLSSFVYWFNCKYERVGYLFQDRYKSEPLNDFQSVINVAKYIHLNPVKANIVENAADFEWSSYSNYLNKKDTFVNAQIILSLFDNATYYDHFMNNNHDTSQYLDVDSTYRITDKKLYEILKEACAQNKLTSILEANKEVRNKIILTLLNTPGTNKNQISRVTGISYNIIRYK